MTDSRLIASVLCVMAAGAELSAQATEQYRSPAGVSYRALGLTEAMAVAENAYRRDPSVANALALGAAQSSTRHYRQAIETYTNALVNHPRDAQLLRWRGHRYLTLRDFERARTDLETAVRLDNMLYGGWYHLGVLHFLWGDHDQAVRAFSTALPLAPDPGERAGATDWLWMSLMRFGNRDEAAKLLASRPDSIDAGNAYTRRLMLYRGEIRPDQVITESDTADVQRATLSLGLANWHFVNGDTAAAREWRERAIASGGWPAFGFIVAEAELTRPSQAWIHAARVACLAAVTESALERQEVLVSMNWFASKDNTLPSGPLQGEIARRLNEAAGALRATLGSSLGQLPRGDGRFAWRGLEGSLLVVAHRGGRVSTRPLQASPVDDPSRRTLATAMAAVLDSLDRANPRLASWPRDFADDSAVVAVSFYASNEPTVALDADITHLPRPLFTIPAPIEQGLRVAPGSGAPRYPARARNEGYQATIRGQFVVDTKGRVIPGSFKTAWDSRAMPLFGEDARIIEEFRQAVVSALPRFRFIPARLGGCAVPTMVQQPFVFALQR